MPGMICKTGLSGFYVIAVYSCDFKRVFKPINRYFNYFYNFQIFKIILNVWTIYLGQVSSNDPVMLIAIWRNNLLVREWCMHAMCPWYRGEDTDSYWG
jgi:hypothetical protein